MLHSRYSHGNKVYYVKGPPLYGSSSGRLTEEGPEWYSVQPSSYWSVLTMKAIFRCSKHIWRTSWRHPPRSACERAKWFSTRTMLMYSYFYLLSVARVCGHGFRGHFSETVWLQGTEGFEALVGSSEGLSEWDRHFHSLSSETLVGCTSSPPS